MFKLDKQFVGVLRALCLLGLLSVSSASAQTNFPVSVMVYGQHVGNRVIYNYRIINNSPNHVASVIIGYDSQNDNDPNNDVYELIAWPIGWIDDTDLLLPPSSATSPQGWQAEMYLMEETPTHAIDWGIANNDHQWDINPGQTLSGMSVTLDKADTSYITGHAFVIFSDRTPSNFTVPLERLDTAPPTLSVSLSPSTLWPPNEKLAPITATITVKDDYDPQPEIKLDSITANEVLDKDDIQDVQLGTDDRQFLLKAEREGKTGRIYTVTYSATDASGNKATASATVTVPHDEGEHEGRDSMDEKNRKSATD